MLNYTTTIESSRTINEIQDMLAKAGADAILTEYDSDRNIAALSFKIMLDGRYISFRLPSDPVPTLAALRMQRERTLKSGKRWRVSVDMDQARRVTWRVLKDWIEAQLAMIEAQQATLAQVFLPYAATANGQTVYEYFANNNQLLLGDK